VPVGSDEKTARSSALENMGNRVLSQLWGDTETAAFAHGATRRSDGSRVARSLCRSRRTSHPRGSFESEVIENAFASGSPCDIRSESYKSYNLAKINTFFIDQRFLNALTTGL
jgi:hypothetical protein